MLVTGHALADIVPRTGSSAGSVISRKTGEEVRFIDVSAWRGVDVHQDLLPGDVLRTNALGQLAVLFSDRTQLRLGRNTTLLVKAVGAASDSVFGLQSGSVWGRAERGGLGLTVETPAAAAAIRGTDFSLSVGADGRTALIVLEGVVDLSNEFGSVTVRRGEAATARIGEKPTKTVIVDPDDRQQMLFYLTLRGAFTFLPASPLSAADMRSVHARIAAIAPARRGAEDRVTFAETALSIAGADAARQAVAEARQAPLSRQQRARLDLVDAMLAGGASRYGEAAALFARALPALEPQRRAVAAYGGYFARALADPERAEEPPAASGGTYGALGEAYAAGFLRDIPAAIDVLSRAERLHPEDPTLPAARAQFALLIDDREQVREALDRSLAIDPDNPTALEARATFRADLESDLDGALADISRAVAVAPGVSSAWNELGLIQSERGAEREAEAALKRAIALDPADPVGHSNLAILLLDQDRLAEAKAEIDRAIELDPSFDIALIARGRYRLQTGELDAAMDDLLAGTTANPAYAQGLLVLGAGYYESGDRGPAAQALENADRLDPNDAAVSSFATAIAIDDYDADGAINHARDTLARSRARGGVYRPLSANRDAGSQLNQAFRLQGLDAWGRFYGDAVFDPLAGASYVDQAVSGAPDPFVDDLDPGNPNPAEPGLTADGFASFFQGLLLSPEMLSGRSRGANLLRRPFLELSLGGGGITSETGDGWTGEAELQGFTAAPFPISIYANARLRQTREFRERVAPGTDVPYVGFDLDSDDVGGIGYVTARPTPNDNIVAYLDMRQPTSKITNATVLLGNSPFVFDSIVYDRTLETEQARAGIGWSHNFGYRNVLNVAVFATDLDQTSDELGVLLDSTIPGIVGARRVQAAVKQRSFIGSVGHTIGVGDLTWRYGVEAGTFTQFRSQTDTILLPPAGPVATTATRDLDLTVGRGWVDLIWDVAPGLKAEGGLFGTMIDGGVTTRQLEPRLGFSWSPIDGQWLSVGYIGQTSAINETTLSPVGVVGLQPNQVPLDVGGTADTFAARWNAEWSGRFFTAIDYQHQDLSGLAIGIPGALDTIFLSGGTVDRLAATADLRFGGGFGAFATVARDWSQNRDPASPGFGGPLPFVPDVTGRVGLTWVNAAANLKATLAGTYVGARAGTEAGDMLGGYWTADAFLTWEPFDKRFAVELAGYNLLDQRFDVGPSTPGWRRTFTGSIKARF